ncbi:hypothetical protein BVU17_11430 [Haloarcula taiwanensis]|uniref:Uncharacterized protein n=1 Tax=Haloarcula taiwanensis TaxID=1932004 RepID=A0A2H5A045_9EURY|nr:MULTISPECIES: hypothetical protein [Haloarcula]AUG48103.1 hypothetical protein BVU17_11430 [Haloarcula taiwanensis]RLM39459.1 hypothetical protein DVK01_02540 [Haloarcula sp. Atlit-120R]RLM47356.1 hypothetical protein DVK00_02285 [Haloarcula sp. Atlit-47R]RLM97373.1 hypothetical protein D3D01_06125 [Haloarcula sp. Atlit-7R]
MPLQPLHMPVGDVSIVTHAANEHAVTDVLVGVGIALCLFGLYYKLILLPANRQESSQRTGDQSPP